MAGSYTNNLPIPTDLNVKPYGGETFCFVLGESKIKLRGLTRNCIIEFQPRPRRPIFENVLIFDNKGGVLMLRFQYYLLGLC
jgi:hypothetical protein